MPFVPSRPALVLNEEQRAELERISRLRTASARTVERARVLLRYAEGASVSSIARALDTNRPKIERCLDKALQIGPMAALDDLAGRGRKAVITDEARTWLLALACRKPKELGYSYELWTTALLAKHVRKHAVQEGQPSLGRVGRGTISKLLARAVVRPHKIDYYLERRDPDFESKKAQVLYVYREVELRRAAGGSMVAVLSFDEKPGIQAIANTAPDLPPVPGVHRRISRDHEYVRHGTVSLMAAIDLMTGIVHGLVVDRHRSREFIEFLKMLDASYATVERIRIVLDNHSAHTSKETRAFLATRPNRFEFVFTPTHGSWLNLIESFFGKMAKTILRGIRVASKDELRQRIALYLREINEAPVIFRWTYDPESASP
jgi:transposase